MLPVPCGESHQLGCGDAAEQREGYRVYIPGAGKGIEDQDLWKGFFFFIFLKESLLCQEKVLGLGRSNSSKRYAAEGHKREGVSSAVKQGIKACAVQWGAGRRKSPLYVKLQWQTVRQTSLREGNP